MTGPRRQLRRFWSDGVILILGVGLGTVLMVIGWGPSRTDIPSPMPASTISSLAAPAATAEQTLATSWHWAGSRDRSYLRRPSST